MCTLEELMLEVKRLGKGLSDFEEKAEKSILKTANETIQASENALAAKTNTEILTNLVKSLGEQMKKQDGDNDKIDDRLQKAELKMAKDDGIKLGVVSTVSLIWALTIAAIGALWKFFTQTGG